MRPEVYLRLLPGLIKLREERTHAGHHALARGINEVLYREAPPKGLNPFLPFLTQKVPSRLPPIADKWYLFHIRSQERIANLA